MQFLYPRTKILIFLILFLILDLIPVFAETYYIDFAGGANTNSGTAKTAAWKNSPGMQGCSNLCANTSPKAGDRFIFKGGVTWDSSAFEMTISWNGTAANPIYFGVDESWFSGASWSRPVFNGEHKKLASGGDMISLLNRSYITFDNIEIKGHRAFENWGPASITLVCSHHIKMTRLYVHDWSLDSSVARDDAHGGIFANNYAGCVPTGNVIDQSVLSNTEARDAGRQNGAAVRSVDVQNSVIHDVSTSQLFGRVNSSRYYNISYPASNYTFDKNYHTNVTYIQHWNGDVEPETEPAYIYNNVIYDFAAGSGGLYVNTCGNASNATYMWNNVIYNNFADGNSNVQIESDQSPEGCGEFYIWNNTLHIPATTSSTAVRSVGGDRRVKIGKLDMRNNHFIASSIFDPGHGVNNLINVNNTIQTNQQANSNGFYPNLPFAFFPSSANAATIAAGVNLSSECISGRSTLCFDSSYAVGLNAANNTVIMPTRTALARPATGAWNTSAYHFSTSGTPVSAPSAPQNLKVQ